MTVTARRPCGRCRRPQGCAAPASSISYLDAVFSLSPTLYYDMQRSDLVYKENTAVTLVSAQNDLIGYVGSRGQTATAATQSNAARKPLFQLDGGGAGKHLALFDGTDDNLTLGSFSLASSALTLALVLRPVSLPGSGVSRSVVTIKQSLPSTSFFEVMLLNVAGFPKFIFKANIGTTAATAVGADVITDIAALHSVLITYNGGTNTLPGSYSLRVNGANVALSATTGSIGRVATDLSSLAARVTNVGAPSLGCPMYLGECAVFSSALGSSDLDTLWYAHRDRWGITPA